MKVEVNAKGNKGKKLIDYLSEIGISINAPCGGMGKCQKCRVKVLSGSFDGEITDDVGTVRACRAIIREDATVSIEANFNEANFNEVNSDEETFAVKMPFGESYSINSNGVREFAMALDIGTTTLCACLVDILTGESIDTVSLINKQNTYGADVVSRICACEEGKLENLNVCIVNQVNEIIEYFKTKYSFATLSETVVCANTVMLHIFANVSPVGMGKSPFTPEFTDMREYRGKELGIDCDNVILMPSVSAFVGSDVVSGAVYKDICKDNKNTLFVDMGTNAEMILWAKGRLFCTSTAAGPALEGAQIECGMGGVPGGISHVKKISGVLNIETVMEETPVGICGSGLVDVMSLMLREGIIDGGGNMERERFYITGDVYVSRNDVREYQLAKSAICSGIQTLMKEADTDISEIDRVIIAGGLGFYIDEKNAVSTGLLPGEFPCEIKAAGNSAIDGARKALLDKTFLERCKEFAKGCTLIDLNKNKFFADKFIENMMFAE